LGKSKIPAKHSLSATLRLAALNLQLMDVLDSIQAYIYHGEQSGYVAECREISVVTQGATLDEVTNNLSEAVALYLEGEDFAQMGFASNPSLKIEFELQPEYA
jgi:predicted RNase H-like HicB family nuclease